MIIHLYQGTIYIDSSAKYINLETVQENPFIFSGRKISSTVKVLASVFALGIYCFSGIFSVVTSLSSFLVN